MDNVRSTKREIVAVVVSINALHRDGRIRVVLRESGETRGRFSILVPRVDAPLYWLDREVTLNIEPAGEA